MSVSRGVARGSGGVKVEWLLPEELLADEVLPLFFTLILILFFLVGDGSSFARLKSKYWVSIAAWYNLRVSGNSARNLS